MSNAKAITYTPAASLQRAPQSSEIAITPESRSQSYVGTVNPVPQPGTLAISYMAQAVGTCFRMAAMAPSKGWMPATARHFQQEHRGLRLTLGALPDVGSSLILTWNVPTQERSSQPPL